MVVVGMPLLLKADSFPKELLGFSIAWIPIKSVFLGALLTRFILEAARQIRGDSAAVRKQVSRRKVLAAQALDDLAKMEAAAPTSSTNPSGYKDIQRKILQAIWSHVKARIREGESTHLNANLLMLEGGNLVVVARFPGGRAEPKPYKRSDLFCSIALDRQATVSVGSLKHWKGARSEEHTPYDDILAVPVLGVGAEPPHLGVITVDSELSYVFGGKEESLAIGLAPYVELIKLVVCSERRREALHVDTRTAG